MDPSIILLLTPLISAGVTQLIKWLAPKTPKILVVCAPAVIGAVVDGIRAATTGTDTNLEMAALAGAGGNAVYSLSKTVKNSPSLVLLCALLASAVFGPGCATVSTPQQRIAIGALIAGNSAQLGAAYDLSKNPGHRAAYEAAVVGLGGLLKDGEYTSLRFQKALVALPVKEFQGDRGVLYVSAAVLAYDLSTQVFFDPQSVEGIKAFATAIRAGFKAALDARGIEVVIA